MESTGGWTISALLFHLPMYIQLYVYVLASVNCYNICLTVLLLLLLLLLLSMTWHKMALRVSNINSIFILAPVFDDIIIWQAQNVLVVAVVVVVMGDF